MKLYAIWVPENHVQRCKTTSYDGYTYTRILAKTPKGWFKGQRGPVKLYENEKTAKRTAQRFNGVVVEVDLSVFLPKV